MSQFLSHLSNISQVSSTRNCRFFPADPIEYCLWSSDGGKAARRLSIEAYLLMNLLMDALLVALALRSAGEPVTRRVWNAAALGTAYALACAWLRFGWLRSLAVQGVVMLLMLLTAASRAKDKLRLTAAMAAGTLLMGGLLEFMLERCPGQTGFLGAVAMGSVLLCRLQDHRRMRLDQLVVRVSVGHGGKRARFRALIDTGNRLQEPFTGLPVLIVEYRLVAHVLPESGLPLRHIPFGGLGGSGFLEAFRPETLYVSDGEAWRRAPEVWIALYPGRMANRVHALAPPVFACREQEIRVGYERRR